MQSGFCHRPTAAQSVPHRKGDHIWDHEREESPVDNSPERGTRYRQVKERVKSVRPHTEEQIPSALRVNSCLRRHVSEMERPPKPLGRCQGNYLMVDESAWGEGC